MFPIIDPKAKPTTKAKIFVGILWKQLSHLGYVINLSLEILISIFYLFLFLFEISGMLVLILR